MIATIHKVAKILNCFTEYEPVLGNLDIATKLDMNPSTVHHLIRSLCEEGMLVRDNQNKYRLGWKLFEWGNQVMYQQDIYNEALPLVQELTKSFNGAVHIGMLDEKGEFIFVLKVASRHAVPVPTHIGTRKPTYCFSTGKILLTYNPFLVKPTIAKGLQQRGPNTITAIDKLENELNVIREMGYSISNNENEYGIYGIAAPIQSYTGKTIAALNMVGPAPYMNGSENRAIIQSIVRTAQSISKELGYIEV
ncbi:IclR family transcriptional regulator [Scopulibacillus darangshiensis]|uniref:IclR family transcriptional regulator n=1 Tax=Scopulibacillus darangshiensis TaxID=442528 RepID=A0A4R2P4B7_9BACL|nr:IclR family transcriptional regulator [Scopulibacillus darangshiensis]TCP28988.1 IclR family transcriptional regulator [Scopulibacillus darangshiensis]